MFLALCWSVRTGKNKAKTRRAAITIGIASPWDRAQALTAVIATIVIIAPHERYRKRQLDYFSWPIQDTGINPAREFIMSFIEYFPIGLAVAGLLLRCLLSKSAARATREWQQSGV